MAEDERKGDRIAKLLARAGVASRREVERMIADKRIAIDGKTVETPATLLESLRGVTVDGKPVAKPEPTRLFAFHKPTGLEADDRVEIVLSGVDAMGTASLNGQLLGNIPAGGEPARFEISRLLEHRNCLVVNVELPRLTSQSAPLARPADHREAGGILGEVRLEIIPPG